MIFNKDPIEYRYWDDPNESRERLKLLFTSKEDLSNLVQNEIITIINELKEADIIRGNQKKKSFTIWASTSLGELHIHRIQAGNTKNPEASDYTMKCWEKNDLLNDNQKIQVSLASKTTEINSTKTYVLIKCWRNK